MVGHAVSFKMLRLVSYSVMFGDAPICFTMELQKMVRLLSYAVMFGDVYYIVNYGQNNSANCIHSRYIILNCRPLAF